MEAKIEILDKFIGKTLAGKYRITEEWRKSGLGRVYRGTHLLMDKPVAIKILSPALSVDSNIVNRFSAEARIVSSVMHPNILNVTDFGTDDDDGTVFIVFEEAGGLTVDETIKQDGFFQVEHAVRVARQIASALSTAHAKEIYHRHLSSGKILLEHTASGAEVVKILDLGSVKPEDDGMFADEVLLEDLVYVAPEQHLSLTVPDQRADVYSLGIILYEMLTGEVPFSAETAAELYTRKTDSPAPPFSAYRDDLPADLEPIIIRALAKNPEMRYPTADALAEDLHKLAREFDETGEVVVPQAAAAAAGSSTGDNRWKTAFVVLAGISLLAVGMIYATYSTQTDPATALQTDTGGMPVQPLNPATGINEQNLMYTAMDGPLTELGLSPDGQMMMPEVMPGGDGYDAWGRGVNPPPGAPPTGGEIITIPGGGGSQFMPNFTSDGQIILVPIPANNAPAVNPTPTPQTPPANSNTRPSPTPGNAGTTPPAVNPTPKVEKPAKPADKPADKPKENPPTVSGKQTDSGIEN